MWRILLVFAISACSDPAQEPADPDSGGEASDASGDDVPTDPSPGIDTTDIDEEDGNPPQPDAPEDPDPFVLPPTRQIDRDWTLIEVGDGARPTLCLDGRDRVHIGTMWEHGDGWVKYARFAPDSLEPEVQTIVAEGSYQSPLGIATLSDGRPVINVHDHSEGDQYLAVGTEDGDFTLDRMPNAGHDGWDNSILVDPDDTVHTGTVNSNDGEGEGVHYGAWTAGEWQVEYASATPMMPFGGTSIGMLSDGTVLIAYYDGMAGTANIARRVPGGGWDVLLIEARGANADVGRYPSLKVGADGRTLHLVYLVRETEQTGIVRYRRGPLEALGSHDLMRLEDLGVWGARNMTTLILDPSDRPIVTFQTRSETWVAVIEEEEVTLDLVHTTEQGPFGQQTSIALDTRGILHLAFWEWGGDFQGKVYYARAPR